MNKVTFNDAQFVDLPLNGVAGVAWDAGIYGVPTDALATTAGGQRDGTEAIRLAPWGDTDPVTGATWSSYQVADFGDCDVVAGNARETGNRQVADLSDILPHCDRTYVLGGDDSINYWCAVALRAWVSGSGVPWSSIALVHFDAHHDANMSAELPDHSTWVADVVDGNLVDQVIQVGVRAPGTPTPVGTKYRSYTNAAAAIRYIRELPPSVVPWLAIDMDVLDPAYAPGVAVPEPFGLDPAELAHAVAQIGPRAKLMTVSEVTPANDVNGITALTAHRLVMRSILSVPPWSVRKTGLLPRERVAVSAD
jgi:arginase family enzyme